jgi:hypothetical protein
MTVTAISALPLKNSTSTAGPCSVNYKNTLPTRSHKLEEERNSSGPVSIDGGIAV